jgi:hypothetical protein
MNLLFVRIEMRLRTLTRNYRKRPCGCVWKITATSRSPDSHVSNEDLSLRSRLDGRNEDWKMMNHDGDGNNDECW